MTPTLGTNLVCQIAIVVRDIEKTRRQWEQVLGLACSRVIETDPQEKSRAQYRGQPTPARAKLAFFELGQVSLELIEPIGEPSTWRQWLDEHGEGVHHIAFRVQDMEGKLSALAACGIPAVQRGDYTGGRYAYCDSYPQLKILLELLENR